MSQYVAVFPLPCSIGLRNSPKDRSRIALLDLDISSIITPLLKDLETAKTDIKDPTAEDDEVPPEDDDMIPLRTNALQNGNLNGASFCLHF